MKLTTPNTHFDVMKWVKNADRVLKLSGRIFIILLVLWILSAFRKVYKDDSYVFSTISVPPNFSERGYTGEVIVDKVLSEMQNILSKRYYDEQNPEAYRKVLSRPDLNFSAGSRAGYFDLQSLFQVGKVLLGKKDKIIKGHITYDSTQVNFMLQMPDEVAISLTANRQKSFDEIIRNGAVYLIRRTTPQYLVYYYLEKQEFAEAEKLLEEINFRLNNDKKSPTYDYDRIQWFMSGSNLKLAQQDFEGAILKMEALQKAYPNDMAAYSQTVNILMSQVVYLENQKADTAQYLPLARKAVEIAETIDKKDFNSLFLDKNMAMGWTYANWAYMLQKSNPNDPTILSKYNRAIELLPHASFAYNNLSYYHIDKKDYVTAEEVLKKALLADPKDGNSWDTYAELMSLKGDIPHFYEYIENALKNSNPTEGITAEIYAQDHRWEKFSTEKRFKDLLGKYGYKG